MKIYCLISTHKGSTGIVYKTHIVKAFKSFPKLLGYVRSLKHDDFDIDIAEIDNNSTLIHFIKKKNGLGYWNDPIVCKNLTDANRSNTDLIKQGKESQIFSVPIEP